MTAFKPFTTTYRYIDYLLDAFSRMWFGNPFGSSKNNVNTLLHGLAKQEQQEQQVHGHEGPGGDILMHPDAV